PAEAGDRPWKGFPPPPGTSGLRCDAFANPPFSYLVVRPGAEKSFKVEPQSSTDEFPALTLSDGSARLPHHRIWVDPLAIGTRRPRTFLPLPSDFPPACASLILSAASATPGN